MRGRCERTHEAIADKCVSRWKGNLEGSHVLDEVMCEHKSYEGMHVYVPALVGKTLSSSTIF